LNASRKPFNISMVTCSDIVNLHVRFLIEKD